MPFSDLSYNLRIELDTKNCDCAPEEIEKMEQGLDPLGRVVRDFPVSDLYITAIYHPPRKDYHVKTALVLPGRTLFTGDRDYEIHPAYERCIRKLVRKVEAYKENLSDEPERAKHQKGTHHDVVPTQVPDAEALQHAVDSGDYALFRRAASVYEEPLRKRIGRWIQRYPEVETQIGTRLTIDDIVEEVFLQAFDGFERRPKSMPVSEWLENLINPSLQALIQHPDEELENINFARSAQEAESA